MTKIQYSKWHGYLRMGKTMKKIDRVLVESRHISNVSKTRSITDAEYGTEHYLERIMFKQSIDPKKRTVSRKDILATKKLKLPEVRKRFQLKLKINLKHWKKSN